MTHPNATHKATQGYHIRRSAPKYMDSNRLPYIARALASVITLCLSSEAHAPVPAIPG